MGADYSFYVKSIATCAPTFFGYIISVLDSVSSLFQQTLNNFVNCEKKNHQASFIWLAIYTLPCL